MSFTKIALSGIALLSAKQACAVDVDQLNPGAVTDLLKMRQEQYKELSAISLQERALLERQILQTGETRDQLLTELNAIKTKIKSLDSDIENETNKLGGGNELVSLLEDNTALLNNLKPEDTSFYANLSSIVYENLSDFSKQQGKEVTKLGLQIAAEESNLENLREALEVVNTFAREAISGKKKSGEFKKALSQYASVLKEFGVVVGKDVDLQTIREAIISAVDTAASKVQSLKETSSLQNNQLVRAAQEVLDRNLKLNGDKRYKVVGVLFRNGGEFSGMTLYDEKAHKLVMAFAGSKSSLDWVKNLFGWNSKANPKHGLLKNMNFHAGFLSHFEDTYDSVYSHIYNWFNTVKDTYSSPTGPKLEIVGTGHSLGGALAEIWTAAAKEVADSMGINNKIGAVTFGAPHIVHGGSTVDVLNGEKYYNGRGNVVRIEDSYDPVPKIVFWKTSPGVTIKQKFGLFMDAAGAMQMFGRNPHSASDYYHAAEEVFKQWQSETVSLRTRIDAKNELVRQLAQGAEKESALTAQIREEMFKLTSYDVKHAKTFQAQAPKVISEKKAQIDSLTDQLIELSESSESEDLTASILEGFGQQAVELEQKIKDMIASVVFYEHEDLWKKNEKHVKRTHRERIKKALQGVVKPTKKATKKLEQTEDMLKSFVVVEPTVGRAA